MKPDAVIASKTTTQNAPLERILTNLRIRKILPHIRSPDVVLDFGCGMHMGALKALNGRADIRLGIDSCFKGSGPVTSEDGATGFGSFSEVAEFLKSKGKKADTILSLACFEHLDMNELQVVLEQLNLVSSAKCRIIGTVPTPFAKPILEFLSYKLRLIDPSQIEDHKVYYDQNLLEKVLLASSWKISVYLTFQCGMNSFFIFEKR